MVRTAWKLALFGGAVCQGQQFLRSSGGSRLMSSEELEVSLRESLEGVMGAGVTAKRSQNIEATMWKTFQALPKNEYGRLAPKTVRYIVHNYFAKEHGWLIEGLEPAGMRANTSDVHAASIIQNKAPALLEALLEERQNERGLTLQDSVAMVAALEHLIFDESIVLLERAYFLNALSPAEMLDELSLHEVLRSYLLLFRQGSSANLNDGDYHRALKARYSTKPGWHEIVDYELDIQQNYEFNEHHKVNPFTERSYSFAEASNMVVNLAENYGKWQNADCADMKQHLMSLDTKGTGRIPLDTFYKTDQGSAYEFTESIEYLRSAGALDESLVNNPGVLVANYLAGPSNCIASNSYYSVCCLNECEILMNEIEEHVKGPSASSHHLLGLLQNMSSSTIDAPRQLSSEMTGRLEQIAEQNAGTIPVHGRLFAQWLHYAFPYECPMPVSAEHALTPSAWLNGAAIGTAEEREQHIQMVDELELTGEHAVAGWTDEEILPLSEPVRKSRSSLAHAIRAAMQLAAILFVLKSAWTALQAAVQAHQGKDINDKKCALPI
jgi:hypothetical protein